MSDISYDDDESYDYADFLIGEEEELSEDFSDEYSESDLDLFDIFPLTVRRKKQVVRLDEFEYY